MIRFTHKPVLVAEVLAALQPRSGGRYADGTVGGGGHAAAILAASAPDGWLFGCDRDGAAIEAARRRLAVFAGRFELRQGNFDELAQGWPADHFDGVLFDLGVSSAQLEDATRGFSFQHDGPLDMRMDVRQPLTAADLLNEANEAELARILHDYGEEPRARRLARSLVAARAAQRFETTRQLATFMERWAGGRGGRIHPATRVFQALRIAVNDEQGQLERGLAAALQVLKPGGRLAVITFHSLEVRVVKRFGEVRARPYDCPGGVDVPELRVPRRPQVRWVTRKAVGPSAAERKENPRSRSAQLRVLEKLEGP